MLLKTIKFLLFPVLIYIIEVLAHGFIFGFSGGDYLFMCLLSSLALGSLMTLFVSLFRGRWQKFIGIVCCLVLALLFSMVIVYYNIFHTFFMWNTLGLAGDVVAFYREAITGIKENWYAILSMFIPLIVFIIFCIRNEFKPVAKERLIILLVTFIMTGSTFMMIRMTDRYETAKNTQSDATETYSDMGVITSTNIDLCQTLFNIPKPNAYNPNIDINQIGKSDVRVSEGKVVMRNVMDMDINALLAASSNETIKDMTMYFTSKKGTEQNEYTGLFEGKNLIFLTLEGFSYKAISKELTPTLYKMYYEGFHFANFYDSMWGGSTATGEYANMTGNFYNSASCLKKSASTLQPTALGNLFKKSGYNTLAYHNGTYTYYSRNLSHPNFGYNYKGIKGGLELEKYSWPNSDHLMAIATIDEYINSEKPFHVYYMTISGHTNYTYSGNVMARKHKDEVKNLPYSENVCAYIATEIEVENMLTYLCEKLEAAGKLDDTVFAMCADHYPYGLSDEALAELYDLPNSNVRGNLELYHNAFILWCSSMQEPVVIDKPCGSIDMVPTLANLFGLEYDSRFISGVDILSNEDNPVIINTLNAKGGSWNWKTIQGTYYTVSKKFVKSENCTLSDDEISAYVAANNSKVAAIKKYSYSILDTNYYKYVFNKDGSVKYPAK